MILSLICETKGVASVKLQPTIDVQKKPFSFETCVFRSCLWASDPHNSFRNCKRVVVTSFFGLLAKPVQQELYTTAANCAAGVAACREGERCSCRVARCVSEWAWLGGVRGDGAPHKEPGRGRVWIRAAPRGEGAPGARKGARRARGAREDRAQPVHFGRGQAPRAAAARPARIQRGKLDGRAHVTDADRATPMAALERMDKAMRQGLAQRTDEKELLIIAEGMEQILDHPGAMNLSLAAVRLVLSLENLGCSEDDLWYFIYDWARAQCGAESDVPALWHPQQRVQILELLNKLVRPGLLRTLHLSTALFVREIEPLGFLDEDEVLHKYRCDALRAEFPENEAYKLIEQHYRQPPLFTFETFRERVRAGFVVYETGHPHRINEKWTQQVTLPFWASHTLVQFDFLSSLAQGAELSFFTDARCSDEGKIASFAFEFANSSKYLVIDRAQFWFRFVSLGIEYGNQWGFRMKCMPVCSHVESRFNS
ncbi:hypothetical protein FVE85_9829 [Porphyridium purpureum]|uniref:BACK domain-containing protein n=1 Tax=Porphyridium purpureum TaxID=35688 RepID=A0A5J4YKA2_PORPP|nr:hypothetical protein FVE85_9829 [Porphyridium purpureum]|eukprot:POR4048..scf289_17